ncbi:MAG TPA: PfkB family carbohydrate kinase, partial [Terriglobia bacterium]|nr:PfkB family carbohydrate kinase [Terriglobia bacterium]
SNVARVFRQLGGDVVLLGFVGRASAAFMRRQLQRFGIHVDVVTAYSGESRTCTILCDTQAATHPTVINEETPQIESDACDKLLARVRRWISKVDGVLTTGSLSTGLPDDLYARILDYARMKKKITAIDATGPVLRAGLLARPAFMKPNQEEFFQLTNGSRSSPVVTLAAHTALTLGKAGAVLVHEGRCAYAQPPQLFDVNPIGAGDAFVAAYLRYLLNRRPAAECLRFAMAAAASDAATLRPGLVDVSQVQSLAARVELRFL